MPPGPISFSAGFYGNSPELPTEVSPFGIGGTAQIRSEGGEGMILFVEAENATYVSNVAPVPLYVMLAARYREITQPGRGRPTMMRLEHPNSNASIVQFNTVTPRGTDLDFTVVMRMEPGDYIGVKFGKSIATTTNPYIVCIASDDASQLDHLARPPRDDFESGGVEEETRSDAVYSARWTGTPTSADKLGAGTALNDIPGVTYNPATGVVTNYGNISGYVLVCYQIVTGSYNFVRAGRSDGVLNNFYTGFNRAFMWIEFDPHVPAATDFLLLPPAGIQVQGSITFYPGSYDDRFIS